MAFSLHREVCLAGTYIQWRSGGAGFSIVVLDNLVGEASAPKSGSSPLKKGFLPLVICHGKRALAESGACRTQRLLAPVQSDVMFSQNLHVMFRVKVCRGFSSSGFTCEPTLEHIWAAFSCPSEA